MLFEITFLISILALLHSYLFFPLIIRLLAANKKNNEIIYSSENEMPRISIIMAVHNVEAIIEKKILSVFKSGFPVNKITFYIGSDASNDNTDLIINALLNTYPQIVFKRFLHRVGKVQIINELAGQATDQILVFTDAHAIFSENSLSNLIKHFKNNQIMVVGGQIENKNKAVGKVAFEESSYYNHEFKVKFAEGRLWGCMIGAFGAFFAIRKESFNPVPDKFLTDDFYISMKVLEKGGKAIFEPEAIVFEPVAGSFKAEFERKSRIATGNIQNLSVLYPLLYSSGFGVAFSFFSHKILRWFGPVFIMLGIISLFLIFKENIIYTILFIFMLLSFLAPIIDYFHGKIQIHVILLRFISHFYYMNIALLTGLFRYMKGVKTNVWEPTRRE